VTQHILYNGISLSRPTAKEIEHGRYKFRFLLLAIPLINVLQNRTKLHFFIEPVGGHYKKELRPIIYRADK
jgi:DNA-binding XRE family transcriptional regulator